MTGPLACARRKSSDTDEGGEAAQDEYPTMVGVKWDMQDYSKQTRWFCATHFEDRFSPLEPGLTIP
jgi:hypothetical protein